MDRVRTIAAATAEDRAAGPRIRRDASRASREEEALQMEDIKTARDKAGSRDLADRVRKAVRAVRVTAAAAAAVRAAAAALTIRTAIIEECARQAQMGREADPEIISRARALLLRLRPRIWRRSGRKKRDASARREISAPGKIISMKKRRR